MSFIFFLISLFVHTQIGFLIFTGNLNFNIKTIFNSMKRSLVFLIITMTLSSKLLKVFTLKRNHQIAPII